MEITSTKNDDDVFDFFCITDFEAIDHQITDFPIILLNAQSGEEVSRFHTFVRPTDAISDSQLTNYINRKYVRMGLAEKWHATAVPFPDALLAAQAWMTKQDLLTSTQEPKKKIAFITCGDWDIGRMVPSNCKLYGVEVPGYLRYWINIKVLFCRHYNKKRRGMKQMLENMNIPLEGFHHSGMDDASNIAKIVKVLLEEKCKFEITANTESLIDQDNDDEEEPQSRLVVRRLIETKKQPKESKEQPKQVTLFKVSERNDSNNKGKVKQITTTHWETFVKQCANKVGLKAKRVFREDGKEITSIEEVENYDNLYISGGEDFK